MPKLELPYNWRPRSYQEPLWYALEQGCKRAAAVWHRRAGKDLFAINWIVREAFRRTGLYWHVFPTYKQARRAIWTGRTRDGRAFLDHFPEALVTRRRDDEMTMWLEGGSMYQLIGSDQDPDSLVGANPVGVVFSEWSLCDPTVWDLVRPILAENGGWAIFIYTARGRNHGYETLKQAARTPTWFHEVLVAQDDVPSEKIGLPEGVTNFDVTKAIPLEAIDEDRQSGMSEEMILQEYYCSFNAPLVGAYYAEQMRKAQDEGRIRSVEYDPELPVITAWDLGVGDSTAIWFMQRLANEHRAIDFYEASGKGLDHYAGVIRARPYVYSVHFGPHDANVRELTTGKSRVETMRNDYDIRMRVLPRHSLDDGIQQARKILETCYFDEKRCEKGIQALREYTKRWDPVNKVFSDTPLHNWASHPADAFRVYAMGIRPHREGRKEHKGPLAPRVAIV